MCSSPHVSPKTLAKHCGTCGAALQSHDHVQNRMPTKNNFVRFRSFHKQQRAPFVVFADFEAICRPVNAACGKQGSRIVQEHGACGFGFAVIKPNGAFGGVKMWRSRTITLNTTKMNVFDKAFLFFWISRLLLAILSALSNDEASYAANPQLLPLFQLVNHPLSPSGHWYSIMHLFFNPNLLTPNSSSTVSQWQNRSKFQSMTQLLVHRTVCGWWPCHPLSVGQFLASVVRWLSWCSSTR